MFVTVKFQFQQTNIINSENSTYLIACSLDRWFNSCNWEFIATCKISNCYQQQQQQQQQQQKKKKKKKCVLTSSLEGDCRAPLITLTSK